MQTTVSTKNTVTLPEDLTRIYRISPGCRLDWKPVVGSDEEFRVRVIPQRADLAHKLMGRGKTLAQGRDLIQELIDERADEDKAEGLA